MNLRFRGFDFFPIDTPCMPAAPGQQDPANSQVRAIDPAGNGPNFDHTMKKPGAETPLVPTWQIESFCLRYLCFQRLSCVPPLGIFGLAGVQAKSRPALFLLRASAGCQPEIRINIPNHVALFLWMKGLIPHL